MVVETDTGFLSSEPFGGRTPNNGDEAGQLGQSTVDLVSRIHATLGSQYDMVQATDNAPLVLRFDISGGVQDANKIHYSTGYAELALDNAHAPMDYVMVGTEEPLIPGCISCYAMCPGADASVRVPWPTICQSYTPRVEAPACPPLETNVRSALAVGANAQLDNNPCHCEDPDSQIPQNYHLSFYDGLKWRILKAGLFSGSGDFAIGDKANTVEIRIKTNTVDIWHRGRILVGGQRTWVESTATDVPRHYLGGFNRLSLGATPGCQLSSTSYTCIGDVKCTHMGEVRCDNGKWKSNRSGFIAFDGLALTGGTGDVTIGACCVDNATAPCIDGLAQSECQTMNGRWAGFGTTCATHTCCPVPFADADYDGDVDQDDFGVFQVCYTGPTGGVPAGCTCFNRVADNTIDGLDLNAFLNCFTGANVPWSASITPSCSP